MPDTTCHMSISLDGFVAGPDQSRENPLGKRGREVHSWQLGDERANEADATAEGWLMRPRGAYVMGRNMFGPIRGGWDEDWDGWWGPEPPYHAPVFVLTRHAREPVEMEGGTGFHFVTEGFDAAYPGSGCSMGSTPSGSSRSRRSTLRSPRTSATGGPER
jgi:dihydrofolate reductase